MEHQFDTIIIGAGLAGLHAAIEIGEPAGVRASPEPGNFHKRRTVRWGKIFWQDLNFSVKWFLKL